MIKGAGEIRFWLGSMAWGIPNWAGQKELFSLMATPGHLVKHRWGTTDVKRHAVQLKCN